MSLMGGAKDALHKSSICLMRASAIEADRAHNPQVVGSNPTKHEDCAIPF